MRKGDPGYTVKARRTLFAEPGTQLRINRLLEGIRSLSGEKIQWYLAAELRDRLRLCGVRITVIDKIARKQYAVEPRQYEGRLLHHLPAVRATAGDVYVELYVNEPKETNRVALFRHGTRVFEDITVVDKLAKSPWTTRYLQGHIDAPFINLTPGTRSGIIHDEAYAALLEALLPLETNLTETSVSSTPAFSHFFINRRNGSSSMRSANMRINHACDRWSKKPLMSASTKVRGGLKSLISPSHLKSISRNKLSSLVNTVITSKLNRYERECLHWTAIAECFCYSYQGSQQSLECNFPQPLGSHGELS
jgi:hypothetical protein